MRRHCTVLTCWVIPLLRMTLVSLQDAARNLGVRSKFFSAEIGCNSETTELGFPSYALHAREIACGHARATFEKPRASARIRRYEVGCLHAQTGSAGGAPGLAAGNRKDSL